MKFWKIRHIPTGLFFKPSKHGSKSNLSNKGKVYNRRPSMNYVGDRYHHPLTEAEWRAKNPRDRWYWKGDSYESRPVIATDWEIVEYNVVEQ